MLLSLRAVKPNFSKATNISGRFFATQTQSCSHEKDVKSFVETQTEFLQDLKASLEAIESSMSSLSHVYRRGRILARVQESWRFASGQGVTSVSTHARIRHCQVPDGASGRRAHASRTADLASQSLTPYPFDEAAAIAATDGDVIPQPTSAQRRQVDNTFEDCHQLWMCESNLKALLESQESVETSIFWRHPARHSVHTYCYSHQDGLEGSKSLDGQQLDQLLGVNAEMAPTAMGGYAPASVQASHRLGRRDPVGNTPTDNTEAVTTDDRVEFVFDFHDILSAILHQGYATTPRVVPTPDCDVSGTQTGTVTPPASRSHVVTHASHLSHVNFFSNSMLNFSPDEGSHTSNSPQSRGQRPNMDQLRLIQDHMAEYMPKMFLKRHDYRIYTQDVIFENNFLEKPSMTQGLSKYVVEIAKFRLVAMLKYANVRMTLLKSTVHEEDGSVRIRWRVSGIPQVRAFQFWKFLPWRYKKAKEREAEWVDGISTFYVDGTGMICKHRLDRMIQEEQKDVSKKLQMADKLGLNVGGAV